MANPQLIENGDEIPLGSMVQPHVEAKTAFILGRISPAQASPARTRLPRSRARCAHLRSTTVESLIKAGTFATVGPGLYLELQEGDRLKRVSLLGFNSARH
jgi:hypothetical protein